MDTDNLSMMGKMHKEITLLKPWWRSEEWQYMYYDFCRERSRLSAWMTAIKYGDDRPEIHELEKATRQKIGDLAEKLGLGDDFFWTLD